MQDERLSIYAVGQVVDSILKDKLHSRYRYYLKHSNCDEILEGIFASQLTFRHSKCRRSQTNPAMELENLRGTPY